MDASGGLSFNLISWFNVMFCPPHLPSSPYTPPLHPSLLPSLPLFPSLSALLPLLPIFFFFIALSNFFPTPQPLPWARQLYRLVRRPPVRPYVRSSTTLSPHAGVPNFVPVSMHNHICKSRKKYFVFRGFKIYFYQSLLFYAWILNYLIRFRRRSASIDSKCSGWF